MNQKNFTNAVSDEVLVKIIDDTLTFKKNVKNRSIKKNLLKLIPAVAVVALVVGLVNFLPLLSGIIWDTPPADAVTPTDEIAEKTSSVDLFLPAKIEKTFFEEKILAYITDERSADVLTAYYNLKDNFYVLDVDMSTERESNKLLDIISEYTDVTGDELVQMCIENDIPYIDPYAHVRFGETRNILLLDIEWHTYDTYLEEVVKPYRALPEEKRELEYLQTIEKFLDDINEKKFHMSRFINGKSDYEYEHAGIGFVTGGPLDISEYCDEDGYYIFYVYPRALEPVTYYDENGIFQVEYFTGPKQSPIQSKSEYDRILKDEIIPFCDDLVERGLLTQEGYDFYTKKDLLEYYANLYF